MSTASILHTADLPNFTQTAQSQGVQSGSGFQGGQHVCPTCGYCPCCGRPTYNPWVPPGPGYYPPPIIGGRPTYYGNYYYPAQGPTCITVN